ncbi:T9SS type A sorting domain-containing protein [Flavobacterium sp.]|uniref:T9SS type A sorting domain-containing protein n=1 Tax=Flavobacterium sp. TaxID=239 RepID=UPI003265BFC6
MKKKLLFLKNSNHLMLILMFFAFNCLQAQVTSIPDAIFEQWLINNDIDTDGVLNHQVATADISGVTELDLYYVNIRDFTGLQDFKALTNLTTGYAPATSMDLSALTELVSLSLYGNSLITIDLSHNLQLTSLNLGNSGNLRMVDVSANIALTKIEVSGYKLASLDLSNNIALTDISLGGGLVNLNITNGNNHNVTRFWAANCSRLSCVKVDAGLDTSGTISDGEGGFYPIWQTYTDDEGNHNTTFSETDCGVYTAIPDAGFEYYLTQNGITVTDHKVLTSDIAGITAIDLTGDYNAVGDFTGIEDFAALTYFKYNRGGKGVFSAIDLSQNTNLTFLEIKENDNLTTINISQNTKLQELNITDGALTKLDISKNPLITKLSCSGNSNLTVLNLKGRADQTAFEAGNTFNSNPKLSCIEVDDIDYATTNWLNKDVTSSYYTTGCPSTAIPDRNFEQVLVNNGYDDVIDGKVITANITGVTSLNVVYTTVEDITGIEDFASLKNLTVYNTGLKKVDLSQNKLLESINFGYNNLTTFDLSQNTALKTAYISDNTLATLDFHNNTNLEDVFLGGPLLNLNMANGNNEIITRFSSQNCNLLSCVKVDNLEVATAPIWLTKDGSNTVFSITNCTQYTAIPDAAFEQLLIDNDIDSGVVDGKVLTHEINTIPSLSIYSTTIADFTGLQDFTALTSLDLVNNVNLTQLDISKNTQLTHVYCKNNKLTNIDVSKNPELVSLLLNNNALVSLDVTKNTKLVVLHCVGNQLTSLDVSQNTTLTTLDLGNNSVTTLDVSKNPELTYLKCYSNQLVTLDLSTNTQLTTINCQNNQLKSVNLKNGNNTNLQASIPSKSVKNKLVTYPIGNFGFQANDPALVILVDNKVYSDDNWMSYKDASAVYLENISLGTGENNFETVAITPNPTQGELYISNITLEKVTVFSLLGNVVKTVQFNSESSTNTVDLSDLTAGLYLVKLSSNGLEKTVKVLKK